MMIRRTIITIILFTFGLSNLVFSQNPTINNVVFSRSELIEDLNMLRDTLKVHPKLYEFTNKYEFDKIYQSIKNQLKDGMTADDFLKIAYPLVERIGCGHSSLFPPMSYIANPEGKTIPLDIKIDQDDIYILSTFPEGLIPSGSKLLAINNRSSKEIIAKLMDYVSVDGLNNLSAKKFGAEKMFGMIYPKFFTPTNNYKIHYQLPFCETTEEIILESYSIKEIWMPKMSIKNPFSYKYREDLNALILTIKSFYFNGNNDEFYTFLEEAFAKAKNEKIENIILDLRGNGGGDPLAAGRLFSYLIPKPLKYFSDVFSDKYAKLATSIKLAANHFDGELYTLIDGGGFSTTGHFVSLLKYLQIGKIIGSELGSTFTCNDNCIYVTLKNTGYLAKIARSTFSTAVEGMRADQGVLPDVHVAFSIKDYVDGVDSEIETIKKMIIKRKQTRLKSN